MKKIFFYVNTVKYLKWQQVYFRLIRKLLKPKVTEKLQKVRLYGSDKWHHELLYKNRINEKMEASFLNSRKILNLPADWHQESPSKLWLYNLHYFENLLSENSETRVKFHSKLLNSWIKDNPVGFGNGWEPYPTSLRIVNILKSWLGGFDLDHAVINSVFEQTSFLSNNLEKHLLGNHYFSNLKALLFSGVIYGNHKWIKTAERGLIIEIPEQILEDGANFELSPMYHSLMLIDMLDMLNLCRAFPKNTSKKLLVLLERTIPKMLSFMDAMTHPDGDLSFFNDAANGIAPSNKKIKNYSQSLGFDINYKDLDDCQIIDNSKSGYFCGVVGDNKIIFDAAQIGPDYLPGHAHADTLSFEMSIGNQRVFVNTGTSEYGLSEKRIRQRKTCSHNTVEVDGKDSSQVWSGFRVAKRARVLNRSADLNKGNKSIELKATHNGYKTLFGGCLHSRKITFDKDSLRVIDSLQGSFKFAKSRFYFHPDLNVSLENDLLKIQGASFMLHSDLSNNSASLSGSSWHPEFGVGISNKVLEVEFESNHIEIFFKWTVG